jgi:hypothetical protein
MKTFGFVFSGLWVGGSGMVKAKNKAEAVKLANEGIVKIGCTPIPEEDVETSFWVIEKANQVIILDNGDY